MQPRDRVSCNNNRPASLAHDLAQLIGLHRWHLLTFGFTIHRCAARLFAYAWSWRAYHGTVDTPLAAVSVPLNERIIGDSVRIRTDGAHESKCLRAAAAHAHEVCAMWTCH